MVDARVHDVAIVGYGPAGVVAAGLLGQHDGLGNRSIVLRCTDPPGMPRLTTRRRELSAHQMREWHDIDVLVELIASRPRIYDMKSIELQIGDGNPH